jgi:hypothetical protein
MRIALAAVLVLIPALAVGQSRSTEDANRLPSIGLPLAQIGLPLPTIGSSGAKEQPGKRGDRAKPDNDRRRGGEDRDRGGDRRGRRPNRNVVVFPFPIYDWGYTAEQPPVADTAPADVDRPAQPSSQQAVNRPTGMLLLDLQPSRTAQLYVDDFYVGTTDELGLDLTLDAGPHNVEIRTPGYEPVAVKVNIEAGRAITYRSALQPLASTTAEPAPARAEAAKPAAPPKPVYFIPGCYLGNVPPKDAGLPASCDQSRAKTIQR